jgi:hypothetical protein
LLEDEKPMMKKLLFIALAAFALSCENGDKQREDVPAHEREHEKEAESIKMQRDDSLGTDRNSATTSGTQQQ